MAARDSSVQQVMQYLMRIIQGIFVGAFNDARGLSDCVTHRAGSPAGGELRWKLEE